MAVCVEIDLLTGAYEAHDSTGAPEWPPHPYRFWAALVAVAGPTRTAEQSEALEALARLGPPVVWAAPLPKGACVDPQWTVYVPSLKKDKLGKRVARWADRAVRPPVPKLRFEWCDDLDRRHLEVLGDLAEKVSYLGRAGCYVVASCFKQSAPPPAGLVRWEPCSGIDASVQLRVPAEGLLAQLDEGFRAELFAEQRRPAPMVGYRRADNPREVVGGPWTRIVRWRLAQGELPGQYVLPACEQLRAAVLSIMGDSCPPTITGHAAPGDEPPPFHAAWMALVDVGHEHASGRVMGFAAALPAGAPLPPMPEVLRLWGRGFPFAEVDDSRTVHWALSAARWTGESSVWASATPVSLPWSGNRSGFRSAARRAVRAACRKAGFPDPEEVEVQDEPFLKGSLPARHYVRTRDGGQRRRACHALVRFPVPVMGPVALGPLRHFGLGVLVPAGGR